MSSSLSKRSTWPGAKGGLARRQVLGGTLLVWLGLVAFLWHDRPYEPDRHVIGDRGLVNRLMVAAYAMWVIIIAQAMTRILGNLK